MNEKDLTDGFNSGYFLAKERPELLKTLLNGTTGNSEYLEGLKAGQKEYQLEEIQQRNEEHRMERQSRKERDQDIGR